jgi:tetratricopeptide (TPR) repeat protein
MKVDSATVVNNGTVKLQDTALIEKIIKFDLARNYIVKNEMMTLDLLRTNNWDRPIYFTSIGSANTLGLNDYFQNEGFAFRLVPIKSDARGRIDKDIMYDNLMNKFKWGNMNDPSIIIDHTINRTTRIVKIRDNFRDLSIIFAASGDTVKAKALIAKCDEIMPISIFTPGLFDVEYANAYYAVGEFEKGDQFLREIIKVANQELEFFYSLDHDKQLRCAYDIQLSMETYRRVLRNAMNNKRQELFDSLEPKFNEYMLLYESSM